MSSSEASISIVIPVYNTEKYIKQCLDSVFNQEPKPDQVIIINDGSTDSSASIVEAYRNKPSVTILTTENNGPGAARSTGMMHVYTDYVHFLDSDDMLAANFVATAKRLIKESGKVDLILFSGKSIDDNGIAGEISVGWVKNQYNGKITNQNDSILSQMTKLGILHSTVHSFGVSKVRLWKENDIHHQRYYHEDEAILFPLMSCVNTVYVTQEIMYYRRVHSSSITKSRKNINHALGILTVATYTLAHYINKKYALKAEKKMWERRISNYTIYYIRICKEVDIKISYEDLIIIIYKLRSPVLFVRVLANIVLRKGSVW